VGFCDKMWGIGGGGLEAQEVAIIVIIRTYVSSLRGLFRRSLYR
jgi:hypothetical protein